MTIDERAHPVTHQPNYGKVFLVRHGETAWSQTGQHTGITDLTLTDHGEEQARALGKALRAETFRSVLVSPRRRAQATAELAGFGDHAMVEPNLAEWDYGGYEGLTTGEIAASRGADWNLWQDGVVAGQTPGEHASEVLERVRAVIHRVREHTLHGDNVLLIAHGHILRAIAVTWVGLPVVDGRKLSLDTGSVSILGREHGHDAILRWNSPTEASDDRA